MVSSLQISEGNQCRSPGLTLPCTCPPPAFGQSV